MPDFAARIRRVRMKDGADVHILDATRDDAGTGENWNGKIVENAKSIAEAGKLTGYIIVGIYDDTSHNCALRFDMEDCAVPMTLWPAWIGEIVRRYTVTKAQSTDTFHEIFEWRQG